MSGATQKSASFLVAPSSFARKWIAVVADQIIWKNVLPDSGGQNLLL